jgi:hypothetical protein
MLVYIFYGHLVHFTAIWYILWPFANYKICILWSFGIGIFLSFWYVVPRKIWQPWCRRGKSTSRQKFEREFSLTGLPAYVCPATQIVGRGNPLFVQMYLRYITLCMYVHLYVCMYVSFVRKWKNAFQRKTIRFLFKWRIFICVMHFRICDAFSYVWRSFICVTQFHMCDAVSYVWRIFICVTHFHMCDAFSYVRRIFVCATHFRMCAAFSYVCRIFVCVPHFRMCDAFSYVWRIFVCVTHFRMCAAFSYVWRIFVPLFIWNFVCEQILNCFPN